MVFNPFKKGPAALGRGTGDSEVFARSQAVIEAWEIILADAGCSDRDLMRDVGACLGSFGFPKEHAHPSEMAKTALAAAPSKAWMSPEQAIIVKNAISVKCLYTNKS